MKSGIGVILVAAGSGERFGGPKAFVELAGRTLLEHAAAPFAGIAERIVVLREEDLGRGAPAGWRAVAGGVRRRDSVAAGLLALDPAVETVLVHDAARPLVDPALVGRLLAAAGAAVVPGVPVADTLKRTRNGQVVETVDRAGLVSVQTPQRFDAALLRRALAATDEDATDEATLVERLGEPVTVVAGDPRNLKITAPADLAVAAALLSA